MSSELSGPPVLRLRLFGGFDVTLDGRPLPPPRSKKDHYLLAMLALAHGRPLRREVLAQTLWPFPETGRPQANYNLRRSLLGLRKALGDRADLIRTPNANVVALDLERAFVDVVTFDRLVAKGDEASLQEAAALYRGALLPECTEAWVLPERDSRRQAYQQALREGALRTRLRGDAPGAVRLLRQAIAVDPLWEDAQRHLMEALAAAGDTTGALSAYQEFLRQLRRDDPIAQPSPETSALYQKLRQSVRERVREPQAAPEPPTGARRRFLPVPLTRLIGRAQAIEEVGVLMSRGRLVTLTGMGGIGKTRLAIAAAEALEAALGDGEARFVDLAAVEKGASVSGALAAALEVREQTGRSLLATLVQRLDERPSLLILDNCEHVLDEAATLCEALLSACSGLRVLATSRQALNVPGEAVFRVPALESADARDLFVERARAAGAGLDATPEMQEKVDRICRRLDAIPLAIELVAAQVRSLSLEHILAGLEERLTETMGSSRTIVSRHRTLRALLDWSHDLLGPSEKALLRRLSVFSGDWTLEAAEAVYAGEGIRRRLSALVDQSLVVFSAERYRLLETVRQYAWERLAESGEETEVRRRHRDFFLSLAEENAKCYFSPEMPQAFERIRQEYANYTSALEFCQEDELGGEAGMRLAVALRVYWWNWGHTNEGLHFLQGALRHRDADREAILLGTVLRAVSTLLRLRQEYTPAKDYAERSLAIRRRIGDRQGIADSLYELGVIAAERGELSEAFTAQEEALAINREIENRAWVPSNLSEMGRIAWAQGEYSAARGYQEEALAVARAEGQDVDIVDALSSLALVSEQQGRYEEASMLVSEALRVVDATWPERLVADVLDVTALAVVQPAGMEYSVRLFGAASALRYGTGTNPQFPELVRRVAGEWREAIGQPSFEALWQEGLSLDRKQALELAWHACHSALG